MTDPRSTAREQPEPPLGRKNTDQDDNDIIEQPKDKGSEQPVGKGEPEDKGSEQPVGQATSPDEGDEMPPGEDTEQQPNDDNNQ